MSLHLNKFIDRVRAAEKRGQRDITISLSDARDIQADLAKLLLTMQSLLQQQISRGPTPADTAVEITGGTF